MKNHIAVLAIIPAIISVIVFASCTAPEPVVQEVEVTRLVPEKVEIEVTVPVTRVVDRTIESPVTRVVEQTVEVTRVVTREVPVTVLVTPTPAPETPTLVPTETPTPVRTAVPTPTPNLATADRANLWLYIYALEWCAPCIGVSADPAFDVLDFGELKVIVRAGRRSETFFNADTVYGEDGSLDLSQSLDGYLDSVTGVSASSDRIGDLRCEEHESSTALELTYACAWR